MTDATTKPDVERLEPYGMDDYGCGPYAGMEPDPDGGYVGYSDYAKLQARVTELEGDILMVQQALEQEDPFGFDAGQFSFHEDDGGAPDGCYFYVPKKAAQVAVVKPLVWEDYPNVDGPVISMAETQLGTYFICDDTDDFTGLYCDLVSHKDAEWFGIVRASVTSIVSKEHVDDHAPIQAAAQADYETRIRSALKGDK